jgi:hypothetical protein
MKCMYVVWKYCFSNDRSALRIMGVFGPISCKLYEDHNLGCLHPAACVRSGDGGFYIRLRNVA